ncbi:MAG: hypothetical protein ABI871_06225 [Chthoniobacterales bacterium]
MKLLPILLATAVCLSGCSMLTKNGRNQRAYEKYVRRSSMTRVKQQSRFRSSKPTMPITQAESEPTLTNESSGPESVSEGESSP